MGAPDWAYADDIDEALRALADGDSIPVAGGTTVIDLLKLGHKLPSRFVDISRLPLKGVIRTGDTLRIGAMTSNTAVADSADVRLHCPALSQAILLGASQQIRNAATVGGNLMQATRCVYFRTPDWPCNRRDAGSGCEAIRVPMHDHAVLGTSSQCIATHPSDMAVALLALDAVVHAECPSGEHRIPISEFYRLPGQSPERQTALPASALITAIEIPITQAAKRSGYIKLRGRASYEFASASVAAALLMDQNIVRSVSIALGGVATKPWRSVEAEAILVGMSLSPDVINGFCDNLLSDADPRHETEYKIGLVRGAVHRLLTELSTA